MSCADRYGTECAYLIDIDHFQRNDEHGHAVGDEVPGGPPRCWCRNLRTSDLRMSLGRRGVRRPGAGNPAGSGAPVRRKAVGTGGGGTISGPPVTCSDRPGQHRPGESSTSRLGGPTTPFMRPGETGRNMCLQSPDRRVRRSLAGAGAPPGQLARPRPGPDPAARCHRRPRSASGKGRRTGLLQEYRKPVAAAIWLSPTAARPASAARRFWSTTHPPLRRKRWRTHSRKTSAENGGGRRWRRA